MKTKFSGKDNDAMEIIKSLEGNPLYKLEIYSLDMNQNLGDSWFVVDVFRKTPNDHWIALCNNNITKSELNEIKVEIREGVGNRRKSLITLRSDNLLRYKFNVIETFNKIQNQYIVG